MHELLNKTEIELYFLDYYIYNCLIKIIGSDQRLVGSYTQVNRKKKDYKIFNSINIAY